MTTATAAAEVREQPSAYRLSPLPEQHPAAHLYTIEVTYRGGGRWAVVWFDHTLNRRAEWEPEPLASDRDEDYLARTRYPLPEALTRARGALPGLVVNGRRYDGSPDHPPN